MISNINIHEHNHQFHHDIQNPFQVMYEHVLKLINCSRILLLLSYMMILSTCISSSSLYNQNPLHGLLVNHLQVILSQLSHNFLMSNKIKHTSILNFIFGSSSNNLFASNLLVSNFNFHQSRF
ncbi:hypothetical protein HanPI659440_Chr10g0381131 [Helianthus annuus]|nr:hypothetical protein HanPI659440_Chr10g0381131 [Helianthus annuus]